MPTDHRTELKKIRTFPQLVRYLRDEMGWPIEQDSFEDDEDLYYDFTPEELGLDTNTAAKIDQIRRLKRLSANQPWGIFFVKFAPGRLPVIALRRILNQVVLKKRATAKAAERTAWAADDLLFVSNYGEGNERQISFAHFSQAEAKHDLPTLKVLGWDNLDTPLHLDAVAEKLTTNLAWPEDDTDIEAWRESWRSAFQLRHREVVTTSHDLSIRLAELARAIRDRIKTALSHETERGPLTKLMKAFQEALIHDLDPAGFADMYAQTITYGLLSARIANPHKKTADDFAAHMRTNPFLKELMQTFLHVGGRRGKAGGPGIDFDELLRTEFGLEDGLADTTTWGEMAKRYKDLKIPEGVSPKQGFVQILDPATGTGTFLVEVIDLIHKKLTAKWKAQGHDEKKIEALWNEYVPRHLLPRLHGYELLMAPYAIAHLKIGLKLYETGYRFGSDERARIYLTNALEPAHDFSGTLEFAIPALAHEAQAVNEIKQKQRFTVVIGNPPYSVTSANFNPFIDSLMDDYKKHVRGEQGLVALADDYLKFIRFSQMLLAVTRCGVWGMITNHGYLKGVIHRGVRKELVNQFNSIFVLDLHGDSNIGERVPMGRSNENVFDIQQGVAVAIGVRSVATGVVNAVRHSDLWGTRNEKYDDLALHAISHRKWTDLHPVDPRYFLIPFDDANLSEYEDSPSIDELMAVNSCGVKTHRDGVVIDNDKNVLFSRISDIASERRLELLRERYGVTDTPHWKLKNAQSKISVSEVSRYIQRLTYRPFDYRWIYYNPAIIEKGDSKYPTLRHMLSSNLALLTARIQATGVFDAVFISKFLAEMKTAESSRSCTVFPLYLMDEGDSRQTNLALSGRRPNLNPLVLRSWAQRLDIKQTGDFGLPVGMTPEDIFQYTYAVFHSPGYRSRYAEFLKIDFPRLPLTRRLELFRALSRLGGELVALHVMESSKLDHVITTFIGPKNPEVGRVGWSNDTVWLDAAATKKGQPATPGTIGFRGVPEAVWNFHIGGYQVCEKWLKDRKGRTLSKDDLAHYQKIVVALNETIRLMKEIDEVIEKHGGWPGAFQTGEAQAAAPKVIPVRPRIVQPGPKERYVTCVPLVPLKAAAGAFSDPQHIDDDGFEWAAVETKRRLCPGIFVAQVVGKSMEPAIPDGAYCLFAAPVEGTRQGKTVLVQLRDATDPESGQRYTVKRYESEKAQAGDSWRHEKITLKPVNPDFKPIILTGADEGQLQVVAEFVEVLGQKS